MHNFSKWVGAHIENVFSSSSFFEVLRYKIIFYIILVQQHYCKSVLSHVAAAVPIDPFLWHVMAAVWTWLVASCLKDYLAGVFSGPWQELPSSFDILISSIGCKHCIISITAVVSYHTYTTNCYYFLFFIWNSCQVMNEKCFLYVPFKLE